MAHVTLPDLEPIIDRRVADFQAARINCAECVLLILAEYYGWQSPLFPRIATGFGGGMGGTQRTCGAFSGALMAIGMLMGRDAGGDKAPAYEAGRSLASFFQARCGAVNCADILGGTGFDDPAFRSPGGKHQAVCEPLVAAVCRYVAQKYHRD
ncbi:MAG: C-GCAxxG-C-C family protein [Oscillospiraceae bacterium]|jgi:C_GCAxxG_C_C family probable redox protein|nr:C-GCAxxG-C-C family protein [Oscillospiraceae bacterium]